MIIVATTTAMMVAAGCGSDSTPAGTAGHDGGAGAAGSTAGATGTAGSTAGSTGAAGASAGTTGTAGATAGSTGTAGASAGTTGTAGAGGATAGTGGATAGAGGGPVDPFVNVTIPPAIAVPAGNARKFRVHAVGTQNYTCTATTAASDGGTADGGVDAGVTTYAWSTAVPAAVLSDENDVKVGMHYVGPTWMSIDGSDVVGMKEAGDPGVGTASDIPWLRLKVVSHMGAGIFADVTYVQRVNTKGGAAPATGCDAAHPDAKASVAYTADYWFYKSSDADAGVTADWPFATVTIDPLLALTGPTVKLKLHALGAQIYTCTGTTTGGADAGADAGAATTTYAWVLKQPDAKLYDATNTQQATHGLGPSWTHKDGSIITGTKLVGVDAPLADAIQWLTLKVAAHSGATGVFTDVTYVQRLNTTKGKAPATGCDAAHVNTDTSSAYTADYYFYTGAVAAADGGTD